MNRSADGGISVGTAAFRRKGQDMFGYIKPLKPELKVKEFDTYQAVYCGLCRQLGDAFGPFAKLTLSYDFTFIAMLAMGLREEFSGFCKGRCMANPLKKKTCAAPSPELSLVAASAMVLFYHKVRDNIHDARGFRKAGYWLLLPFASGARKKAMKRFPEVDEAFSSIMSRQFELEQQHTKSIDAAAEPTAAALRQMVAMLGGSPAEKRVLERFGYLLGRWVYLMDALDDLENDAKHHSYNPFLERWEITALEGLDEAKKAEIIAYGRGVLNITVAELGVTYELLELKRYKTILDNIIYLGLPNSAEEIFRKKADSSHKEPEPSAGAA